MCVHSRFHISAMGVVVAALLPLALLLCTVNAGAHDVPRPSSHSHDTLVVRVADDVDELSDPRQLIASLKTVVTLLDTNKGATVTIVGRSSEAAKHARLVLSVLTERSRHSVRVHTRPSVDNFVFVATIGERPISVAVVGPLSTPEERTAIEATKFLRAPTFVDAEVPSDGKCEYDDEPPSTLYVVMSNAHSSPTTPSLAYMTRLEAVATALESAGCGSESGTTTCAVAVGGGGAAVQQHTATLRASPTAARQAATLAVLAGVPHCSVLAAAEGLSPTNLASLLRGERTSNIAGSGELHSNILESISRVVLVWPEMSDSTAVVAAYRSIFVESVEVDILLAGAASGRKLGGRDSPKSPHSRPGRDVVGGAFGDNFYKDARRRLNIDDLLADKAERHKTIKTGKNKRKGVKLGSLIGGQVGGGGGGGEGGEGGESEGSKEEL